MSSFDVRLLITPLVSSNFSYAYQMDTAMSILSMYDYNLRVLNVGYKIAFLFVIDIA